MCVLLAGKNNHLCHFSLSLSLMFFIFIFIFYPCQLNSALPSVTDSVLCDCCPFSSSSESLERRFTNTFSRFECASSEHLHFLFCNVLMPGILLPFCLLVCFSHIPAHSDPFFLDPIPTLSDSDSESMLFLFMILSVD